MLSCLLRARRLSRSPADDLPLLRGLKTRRAVRLVARLAMRTRRVSLLATQTNSLDGSQSGFGFLAGLAPSVVRSLAKGPMSQLLIRGLGRGRHQCAAWQAMQFQRDLACLARRAAVMDRGIDAIVVCETGSTANRARLRRRSGSWDTRRATRAWGGGRAGSSCASPRRCARGGRVNGGPDAFQSAAAAGAPARQRSCGRGGRRRPRVRGAAGAARTSGARRPSRRRERRTISRRRFCRAPVGRPWRRSRRTRAADGSPAVPGEFLRTVVTRGGSHYLFHRAVSTR